MNVIQRLYISTYIGTQLYPVKQHSGLLPIKIIKLCLLHS